MSHARSEGAAARDPGPRLILEQRALQALTGGIFRAVGCPALEAEIIARDLVDADVAGVGSHGVMRIPEYVAAAQAGDARPGAALTIASETPATALLDGGRNFGQVVGRRALDIAMAKARQVGAAVVVVRETHHLGRLGALAERAAAEGMISLMLATVRPRGHFVVPWGGRDGRLGTNPIAYGVPSEDEPIVSDFATSVVPEGVVRSAFREGHAVLAGAIVDADGRPTVDPAAFYGPPKGGLLPFGGQAGHKGFAMSLLAETLAGALAGSRPADASRSANGLWMCVLEPAAFGPQNGFLGRASELAEYIKSARPAEGHDRVRLPGQVERERRAAALDHVTIDARVWRSILDVAAELGVAASAVDAVTAEVSDTW